MKAHTTYLKILKMNVPARMDFTGTWGARSGSRCRS